MKKYANAKFNSFTNYKGFDENIPSTTDALSIIFSSLGYPITENKVKYYDFQMVGEPCNGSCCGC
jgi:hypothetical protein